MSGLRYRRGIDALRAFGPIYREYQKRGAETGPLHLPIFDQLTEQVLTRFFQNFQHDQTRVEAVTSLSSTTHLRRQQSASTAARPRHRSSRLRRAQEPNSPVRHATAAEAAMVSHRARRGHRGTTPEPLLLPLLRGSGTRRCNFAPSYLPCTG